MRLYLPLAAIAAAFCAAPARAQVAAAPDGGAARPAPVGGADLTEHDAALKAQILTELKAEDEARVAKLRDELKEQIRAEMTTAAATHQEFEELPEEKPKLQLLELNGYFRVRPTLFQNMNLGWTQADPNGYFLFPRPESNPFGRTEESTDMRFRVEPTLNVSEDIRIRGQIDVLDNLVLGSTPELSAGTPLTVNSQSQVPPSTFLGNLQQDSFRAKRLWAEVTLPPIGQLRFGRMGNHWGLGIYQNDGNCLDCDYGNTVDRIALVLKIANHYFIPMLDFVGAGLLYNNYAGDQLGQPVAFDKALQSYQYGLQIARRDSDAELKTLEEKGEGSLNYGFYGTIRNQDHDLVSNGSGGYSNTTTSQCPAGTANPTPSLNPNGLCFNNINSPLSPTVFGIDGRNATFYVPDLWFRYKTRRLRLESELVYVTGTYTINAQQQGLSTTNTVDHHITQQAFGGAVQGEYKFLSDLALSLGWDLGLATGNHAYGFGNQPGRTSPFGGIGTPTSQGSIDGNPILCQGDTEPCLRSTINAFNFSRDYRIDQILWRQLLGGVTDAFFLKPTIKYRFFEGLDVSGSLIYSQAMVASSTPGNAAPLGLEGDIGIHYKTDDGFIANLDYGLLVPFSGLNETNANVSVPASVAQTVRLFLGIKY